MECFQDYKDTIEPAMMEVLETYFENANSLNSAWSIREGEDPYLWDIRIHGDIIRHLMNNEYLEDQVVRYYSYRLFKKRENEKMADSVEHRYAESAFMTPDMPMKTSGMMLRVNVMKLSVKCEVVHNRKAQT
ncbi:uncharacterized protein LOC113272694 [Papaver somniferum]|uniref:uncharacterized protein LOC113272694 n=1 Tax=Papaver somniferum TaxID=3469 RepID=UPI000E6FF046|nr:uncharacterized protein LOC113272694 [Papaver somniferum]